MMRRRVWLGLVAAIATTLLPACGDKSRTQMQLGTTSDLYSVTFVDARQGWAVGERGTILHTDDAGVHWMKQASGTDRALLGVDFVDERRGWAVGEGGTVLASRDGGATWRTEDVGTRALLTDVAFADARHGLLGGDATLLVTDDGGRRWRLARVGEAGMVDGLAFSGRSRSYALTQRVDSSVVLRSDDGGAQWTTLSEAFPPGSGDLCFVESGRGWVCSGVTVWVTRDDGASWSKSVLPLGSGGPEGGSVSAVSFADDRVGWAVGGPGIIVASSDGGKTWTSQSMGSWTALYDVAAIDRSHACVVGERGTILLVER